MNLKERASPVATRIAADERLVFEYVSRDDALILPILKAQKNLLHYLILLIATQNKTDPRHLQYFVSLKLRKTASHNHKGICIVTDAPPNHLTAFFISLLRHRTCVDDIDIRHVIKINALETGLRQTAGHVTRLAEIQFAAERMECRTAIEERGGVNHKWEYTDSGLPSRGMSPTS